jgi:hypothetical protein
MDVTEEWFILKWKTQWMWRKDDFFKWKTYGDDTMNNFFLKWKTHGVTEWLKFYG